MTDSRLPPPIRFDGPDRFPDLHSSEQRLDFAIDDIGGSHGPIYLHLMPAVADEIEHPALNCSSTRTDQSDSDGRGRVKLTIPPCC